MLGESRTKSLLSINEEQVRRSAWPGVGRVLFQNRGEEQRQRCHQPDLCHGHVHLLDGRNRDSDQEPSKSSQDDHLRRRALRTLLHAGAPHQHAQPSGIRNNNNKSICRTASKLHCGRTARRHTARRTTSLQNCIRIVSWHWTAKAEFPMLESCVPAFSVSKTFKSSPIGHKMRKLHDGLALNYTVEELPYR
ncbi:hypothetical protein CEXT_483691 [Caerostris extrusa]|uniref:Uncharacterized protein n=1 Tax=Caerostris extrusa TaxID=172846 RepID=A0AAV4QN23_CAEEX|nr:hypothetical protein CEXT_483691 [Caerostris extrusa]